MQRKFIYFINPISGTKNKAVLLALIRDKTTRKGIPFEIIPTTKNGEYGFLPAKVREEQVTDIIVCAGDGTVSQVVAAIRGVTVNIGIIPMGSGNGLALAAGISTSASRALSTIFGGKAALVDGFSVNGHFSCMLCGLGLDAQVAHDFAHQATRGLATYIRESIKNFFTAKAYPFLIQANETSIETEAFFISIANSNQFGNHVTIAPQASISDGLLDIVVVNKMSKIKMVYTLLMQIRLGQVKPASETNLHGIHYFQSKKLSIINKGKAPLHIDGEPASSPDFLDIEVIPGAFRLLTP